MENLSAYDVILAYPAEKSYYLRHMMPLGILSIAAVLEKNNYSVKLVDFNFYKGDFQSDLNKWKPKIIGIGGTTPTRNGSFKIARMSRQILPETPIVYGGVHATFASKDTLNNVPEIDYILRGEADFSFLDVCNKIIHNSEIELDSIAGLSYRQNDSIIENNTKRINDLNELPIPARHLFEYDHSLKLDFYEYEAASIMMSRGCPENCTFCSASRMFPGGIRYRSVDLIKQEIDLLIASKPIKGLKIFDSTFTASREHVLNFCEMIKDYGLLWECEIRVDTVDFALLKEMKESGCYYVDIGIETTNERILKELNKNITLQQAEQVLAWCQDLEIKTKTFFIFGHIGQSFKECMNDVRWLRKHKNTISFFSNALGVKMFPGTILERQVKKLNLLPENFSWAKFKPPLRNIFSLELEDNFIVSQKKLSLYKIFIVGLILNMQGSNLSGEHLWKSFISMSKSLINLIVRKSQN